ncbi:tetratricopeptide repeat protein [Actinosynnema sp. NPDC020468]|uniref:tetratricopeptide repeat protein n=1 Tax=Actinosynnema sp. NPDC020468 TaxID=3154488 RepID=UPI0033C25879
MDLGAPHGIRFRFEAGLLRAVLVDGRGTPPIALAEHLTADVDAREPVVAQRPDGAVLGFRFDLPAPARWLLAVEAPGEVTPDGVEFDLPGGARLTVSGTERVVVVADGACVDLPVGESDLVLEVLRPPVADTVVVCRPDQVRAAAVVLSCLPADRFTPVVTDADTADLLAALGARRAVHLADGPDLGLAERVSLVDVDPADLTAVAWEALRPGERARVLEVPSDFDPATALFTALRAGSALRVVAGAEPVEPPVPAGAEAVLVEDTGDVDVLVAALYAHHRGARLVVTPKPDLTEVRRVVAEEQERVAAAAGAIGDAVKGVGVVEALWRYLSTGGHDPFTAVEAVVTAQVPAEAVVAVGERALTAFTTGLPYPFVRTWARKPIGHVVGEAVRTVLTELRGEVGPRSAGFRVALATGAFPAADPAHHRVVLTGGHATTGTLRALVERLPVDLLLLTEHEVPFEPEDLTRRALVFDNTGPSWTDAGRRFLRAGARGYVGSLWSIPADLAADFARAVVHRLTAEGEPVAHAVVSTGTPGGIARSYVYVGTVTARLDPRRAPAGDPGAALAGCALLAAAARDCPDGLAEVLHRDVAALRAVAETGDVTGSAAYVDVLLEELALAPEPGALVDRVDAALPGLDLPAGERDRRWARRFELTGLHHEARGDHVSALRDLERCAEYGDACRDRAGVLLRVARLWDERGEPERAAAAAREAHDAYRVRGDRSDLLEAIDVLGGLSRRSDDHEGVVRYAAEGHDLAAELGDRARQARFTLDEAGGHRNAGDLDAAISAAVEALELYREVKDEHAELEAVRLLGWCHRDRGDHETALHYGRVALALAERLHVPAEVAAAHEDLGLVLTLRREHPAALEHHRHAVETAVAHGEWALGAELLPRLAVGAVRASDPEALWTTALCGGLICETARPAVWQSLVPLVVDSMRRAIETGPPELTERGMTDFASAVTAGRREAMPPQVRILADVVVVLLAWLMNRVDDGVTAFAREVDTTTGGVLNLAAYVSVPHRDRVRGPSRPV